MKLPATLAPWATELALFPAEVALSFGDFVRRAAMFIGPMRTDHSVANADGSGYDGIDRRGSYERLLLTEWLLADELPDEFTRRAANGEHMFLRPARRAPSAARTSTALFDAGPSQLGSPRVAQLALLIVLARRAAAAGATFRWGTIQSSELRDDVTDASMLAFMNARTIRGVDRDALATRVASLSGEVFVVGGERAVSAAGTASRMLVRDVLSGERRSVEVELRAKGAPARRATLELPPEQTTARLLRDPFSATAPALSPVARVGVPHGNLLFATNATKLHARTDGGVLAIPIPNSPRAGVGSPKLLRAPGVIAAVGRSHRRSVMLVADPTTRHLSTVQPGSTSYVGHYTSSEGPILPHQPLDGDPLRPLLFRGNDVVAFVDSRGSLFELYANASPKLVARNVLCATSIAGGYAFVGIPEGEASLTHVMSTTTGTSVQPLEIGPVDEAFLATHWTRSAPSTAIVLGRRSDRLYTIFEGSARTEITAPAGSRVVGIHASASGARSFELVVVDASGTSLRSIWVGHYTELLRAPAPVTSVAIDSAGTCLAALTLDDKLVLYSIARRELLHTFDFRQRA